MVIADVGFYEKYDILPTGRSHRGVRHVHIRAPGAAPTQPPSSAP